MGWWYDYDEVPEDKHTLRDYKTQSDAIVIDGPVYAVSKHGDIGREWWGQQWVQAMERMGHGPRLQRGRRYARNGSVKRLEIGHGIAYAPVKGSRRSPYRTAVHLKPLSDAEWKKALAALADQAIYSAKLLAGEMPGDIEGVFQGVGLSLFPRSKKDIIFECSCPDWGDPCKHAAAVYYLVAEQLDADPFVLFHLKGKNRAEVLSALRALRGAEDDGLPQMPMFEDEPLPDAPPLDADLGAFWSGLEVNLVRAAPMQMPEPFALRQLGKPPGNAGAGLRSVYNEIAYEASLWLGLDGDDDE